MSRNSPDRNQESQAEQWDSFKELLDEVNDWPSEYVFKFIVPKAGLASMQELFNEKEIVVRASARGNYLSITLRETVESADEVVAVYKRVGDIDGVISL